ncbi:MAG TPA: ParB N-terminal domain-containing protein, partial [Humibacillus xanthopallidus]|nr:ParB N-terminal domain-containing protein [Humibacillus xanthopallidus]
MAEKRRALGRGLGALIPSAPSGGANRPVDVFFTEQKRPETGEAGGTTTLTEEPPRPVHAAGERGDLAGGDTPGQGDGVARGSDGAAADGSTGAPVSADAAETDTQVDVTIDVDAGPALAPVPGAEFAELPVDSIRPNPKQPRTVFDEDQLAELVHSIREIGV